MVGDEGKEDSLRVQDAIHDVLKESIETGHGCLVVRLGRDGEEEQDDSREQGCNGDGAFAANVFDIHSITGEDRAWYTDDGGDGVIAVNDVGRSGWDVFAGVL